VQIEYTYEPFGKTSTTGSSNANSYQYTSRENDGTGFYYYRARYYSPGLQRFLSEDPIGFWGGDVNLYGYVSNDPLGFNDPFGLDKNSACPSVPEAPPDTDIDDNIKEAKDHWSPWWFYNQVKNGGPWDYKQSGPQYQDFGNFNYGATGASLGGFGIPSQLLRRFAGWAQRQAGTSRPEWGTPWGQFPYGDDPADQDAIGSGIAYASCR